MDPINIPQSCWHIYTSTVRIRHGYGIYAHFNPGWSKTGHTVAFLKMWILQQATEKMIRGLGAPHDSILEIFGAPHRVNISGYIYIYIYICTYIYVHIFPMGIRPSAFMEESETNLTMVLETESIGIIRGSQEY